MNRRDVVSILESNCLSAQSKFGQNFLCDDNILDKIVNVSSICNRAKVLEIGPGIGSLTEAIVGAYDDIESYVAVEIDRGLTDYLIHQSSIRSKIEVICSDYMKLESSDYLNGETFDYVISNIPYYVMTPIIKKLILDCFNAKKMTFMIELDALDRVIAAPRTKQYGPLSVLCSNYGIVRKEFCVSAESFYPKPHTTSVVITLTKRESSFDIVPDYIAFVDAAFSRRRKTIINSLSEFLSRTNSNQRFVDGLIDLGYTARTRAEEISPNDYIELYRLYLI